MAARIQQDSWGPDIVVLELKSVFRIAFHNLEPFLQRRVPNSLGSVPLQLIARVHKYQDVTGFFCKFEESKHLEP